MTFVSIDFESRSTVDLRRTGVYPYAAHQDTDLWCMSYSFEGEDAVHTWVPGDTTTADDVRLMAHVEAGGTLRAWNSGFEYVMWNQILAPRYGWPETTVGQWVDTAAEAAAMALPRGLGKAAEVLGMDEEKDDKGYRLMMQMARPRSIGAYWFHRGNRTYGPFAAKADGDTFRKAMGWKPKECRFSRDDHTVVWWDDSLKLVRLIEYCEQDVRTEKAMALALRDLHAAERGVFLMTQRMNDTGVPVDVELVKASQEMLDFALEDATQRLRDITDGAVRGVTKVSALREWVNANGLDVDNLRKDTVRDILNGDLPDGPVREALQIRQDAGKTSTAKLEAFLRCTGDDNRARGLLLYHGASTGRWAGRLIQPQNFPRPDVYDVEPYIDLVKARDYEALLATGIPVPVLVSSLLRSMFCAPEGRTFMCADYSQVEARVLAWIAGQNDLVELFASGGKVYETMAAHIFKKAVEEIGKDSFERQIGKNVILGAGFQMGADRYAEQVREQTGIILDRGGFRLTCLACRRTTHVDSYYMGTGPCYGCGRDNTVECDEAPDLAAQAIEGYREKNSAIPRFWQDIERTAINAVRNPGRAFEVGASPTPIKFLRAGGFLWCQLPSGRRLAYAKPEIRERTLPKPYQHVKREGLSFLGVDSMTNQWRRHHTYGGHLTENVVQAMARDLIAGGMLRLQQAGYTPILTVHDEVLVEVDEGTGDFDRFMDLVTTLPRWAEGLPLAGEGWTGRRYRK